MLIFIHFILYIFICSLQSITTNVYGIEDHFNINDKDLQPLIM